MIKTSFTLKEVRTLMFRAYAAGAGEKLSPGFAEWNMNRKELRRLFPKIFFRRLKVRLKMADMTHDGTRLAADVYDPPTPTMFRKVPNWNEILYGKPVPDVY